jgi:hypothetical protein
MSEFAFDPGQPVSVKCFSFTNPYSINGPFGTFQLWVQDTDVAGQMTMQTIFGMGTTTLLNLSGTLSGTDPIVCNLQSEGITRYNASNLTLAVEGPLTMSFSSDWTTGNFDGLNVIRVPCG